MLHAYIPRFEEGLIRSLTFNSESYKSRAEVRRVALEKINE